MAITKIKTKEDIKLVLVLDDGQNTLEKKKKNKIKILEARKKGSSLCPPMVRVKNTAS